MKETYYFSHDYNTRSDLKVKRLIKETGFEGYGVFWAIIEDLYNNDNRLDLDFGLIAYDLRVDEELVKSIITEYDLFVIDIDYFYSQSIENRLDHRNEKSKKAKASINKRWDKERKAKREAIDNKEVNTTVIRPNNDRNTTVIRPKDNSNTIKERKGKDKKGNKGKDSIGNNNNTATTLARFPYRDGKNRANDLFQVDVGLVNQLKAEVTGLTDEIIKVELVKINYWLEEKPSNLKTYSGMPRFLHTWMINAIKYNKNNSSSKNGNNTSTNEKYAANRAKFAEELNGYYPD